MDTVALRNRFSYAALVLIVIALGILSRKIALIPLFVGDVLYAVMMFFLIKCLFIKLNHKKVAWISLSVCYLIEISQLYQGPWIIHLRNTRLGALVLGSGFLWSDIAAYTLGTAICMLLICLYGLMYKKSFHKES